MHVDFDIYDCDGSDNIDIDVDAYVYSIYSSFAYAGLGLVGVASAVMFRNRRRKIQPGQSRQSEN